MALKNRPIKGELLFHCSGSPVGSRDSICLHGVQGSLERTARLTKHDGAARAAGKETAASAVRWDNAVAESFFKTLKSEMIYHANFATRQQAKVATFEYIEG
jgi:putative transposase